MGPPSPPRAPHPRGWRWRLGWLPGRVGVEETMPHHHGSALPVGWRLLFLEGRQAEELTWAAVMRPVAAADAAVIAERVPKSSAGLPWPLLPSCLAWGLLWPPCPQHLSTRTEGALDNNTFLMCLEQPAKIPGLSWCCVSANSRHPDERAGREASVISANANTCRKPRLLQAPRRMWAGWCRVCASPTHPEISAHPDVTTPSPGLLLHLGFRSCSAPARPHTCPRQQEGPHSPLPPLLVQPAPSPSHRCHRTG